MVSEWIEEKEEEQGRKEGWKDKKRESWVMKGKMPSESLTW